MRGVIMAKTDRLSRILEVLAEIETPTGMRSSLATGQLCDETSQEIKREAMDVSQFFHRMLHAFDAPKPAPLPQMDERFALGTLLVRAAMTDDRYAVAEIAQIDRLLSRIFELGPIEAAKMRATCEKIDRGAPDHVDLALLIQSTVSAETRLDTCEALWEVALADGELDDGEVILIGDVRKALGLTEEDERIARGRAEQALSN
ncbi:MAG: TerB family tellurite resistance protein [Pseudomonadota bacterium]